MNGTSTENDPERVIIYDLKSSGDGNLHLVQNNYILTGDDIVIEGWNDLNSFDILDSSDDLKSSADGNLHLVQNNYIPTGDEVVIEGWNDLDSFDILDSSDEFIQTENDHSIAKEEKNRDPLTLPANEVLDIVVLNNYEDDTSFESALTNAVPQKNSLDTYSADENNEDCEEKLLPQRMQLGINECEDVSEVSEYMLECDKSNYKSSNRFLENSDKVNFFNGSCGTNVIHDDETNSNETLSFEKIRLNGSTCKNKSELSILHLDNIYDNTSSSSACAEKSYQLDSDNNSSAAKISTKNHNKNLSSPNYKRPVRANRNIYKYEKNENSSSEESDDSGNDDEYQPDENSQSEEDDQDNDTLDESVSKESKECVSNLHLSNHENNSYEVKDDEIVPIPRESCFVPESSEGGKWYDKGGSCPYCFEFFARLDRHLTRMHKKQRTVIKILSLPKRSQERLKLFSLLINYGNHRFSNDRKLNPTGKIIAKRRLAINRGRPLKHFRKPVSVEPSANSNASNASNQSMTQDDQNLTSIIEKTVANARNPQQIIEATKLSEKENESPPQKKVYMPKIECPECFGYYAKNYLSRHINYAHSDTVKTARGSHARSKRVMNKFHPLASKRLRENILPFLDNDEIGLKCQNDDLIILYGNKYAERHTHVDQGKLIRAHMRLLQRLLFELQAINPSIENLSAIFRGIYFDDVIKACKNLSGYNEETDEVTNIYNGRTLYMMLERLIIILRAEYSKKEKKEEYEWLSTFSDMLKNEYSAHILSKIKLLENKKRRNAFDELPVSNDLAILDEYLKAKTLTCVNALEKKFDFDNWKCLGETLLVSLQKFSSRRAGEIERLTIDDFKNRKICNEDDEYYKSLSKTEQKQARKYDRIDGQGKKIDGIDSTTYVSKLYVKYIDLFLTYREQAGVPKKNNFLFGLPSNMDNRMKHINACATITKLTKECNDNYKKLQKPEAIRGTNLRKRFATKFGTLNQNENLQTVAEHMSHTTDTHKKFYRNIVCEKDVKMTYILERINNNEDEINTDESLETDPNRTKSLELSTNNSLNVSAECKKHSDMIDPPDKSTDDSLVSYVIEKSKVEPKKIHRTPWSLKEKDAFNAAFSYQLENMHEKIYPTSNEIRKAFQDFPCLQRRGEKAIRTKFSNLFTYLNKNKDLEKENLKSHQKKKPSFRHKNTSDKSKLREERRANQMENLVLSHFSEYIDVGDIPSKLECHKYLKMQKNIKLSIDDIRSLIESEIEKRNKKRRNASKIYCK